MSEDPFNWTCHATIMKKSVAHYYYKSKNEFMKDSRFFAITPEVIDYINTKLYNGNPEYDYGEFALTEIELNEMNKYVDYYVVDHRIPIPGASNYDTIRPPPEITTSMSSRNVTDLYGDLPERTLNDFPCGDCGLHFHSDRQLKRHQRHCKVNSEKRGGLEFCGENEMVIESKEEDRSEVQKGTKMANSINHQADEEMAEEPPSKRINRRCSGRTGRHYVNRNQQQQQVQSHVSAEVVAQPSPVEGVHQNQEGEARSINTLDGPMKLSKEDVCIDMDKCGI